AQLITYYATPTDTLNHCVGAQQTLTITVQPKIYTNTFNSPYDRCSKSPLGLTITTNSLATYSWIAADNLNTTGESITTQTTGVINDVVISTSNQVVNYTVIVTSIATGCPSIPVTATVNIHPQPVFT